MADVFATNRVMYSCTCGSKRAISKIYFCRHCLKLRCGDCVSHEIDSHYCPNCLEYMPSQEAKLKKNRCANCFDCPSCMHTLTTRATNVQVPSADDPTKIVPKKVYYLVCGFCRWTSRDVGIPDQNVATGGWPEVENPNAKKITALQEYYRALAQKEKIEKDRRKFAQRCSYLHFSDKFGVSAIMARKPTGLAGSGIKEEDGSATAEEPTAAEAVEEVEALPEAYLTQVPALTTICTIRQRLMQPETQPSMTSDLYPHHKHLLIKRSQRCKECEHNLSKPEYNPSSIKFKIQLTAFYHIMEMRIKSIPTLRRGVRSPVELTLCNPTGHLVHAFLLPIEVSAQADIELSLCEFQISPRDDTAEFDDLVEGQGFRDDPEVVTFRKSNKIGLLIHVTPKTDCSGDVKFSLGLKHDFVNLVVQLQAQQREPKILWLNHTLHLNLGAVALGE